MVPSQGAMITVRRHIAAADPHRMTLQLEIDKFVL
jgi:hypothetical protein